MNRKKYIKFFMLLAFFIMSILIFVAIMSSATLLFGSKKVDLTKLQRFSLSESSKNITKAIKQPININIYASNDLDSNYPELGLYQQNIWRLLEKLQNESNGKISISLKNPEPYSPTEYEAKSLKIRSFPDAENTHNLYFGATFSNGEGKRYVIPYFSVQRQNYIEYDISRIISKLDGNLSQSLGVVSFAGNISNWQIFNKLAQDYRLTFLDNKISTIPNNIDTLLIYNPQQVDVNFIYALDQYIMRGGNLILLIDPYAETIAQKYPYTKKNKNFLLPLIQKWGIEMDENKIIADTKLSRAEYQTSLSEQTNPTYINLTPTNMNIPSKLGQAWPRISFQSAGSLNIKPQNDVQYIPLFFTTEQGKLVDADIVKNSDIKNINNALSEQTGKYDMGYWVEGMFNSFFEKSIFEGTSVAQKFPPFISSSIKPSKILVIADSDFIADATWNQTGYQKGAGVYDQVPSNNNADFILSAVDYMFGNEDLSQIRVKYLTNEDKNIAEQIYAETFNDFADEYQEKEQKIKKLQQDLAKFQQKLNKREIAMSLLKIQELDEINRKQQIIKEEIKALNYKIQQKSGQVINHIILMNIIIIPFGILILGFLCFKIYIYRQKQKNIRIINE